ncbi:MAG: hypothetical protein V3V01_06105 [Acidimicrobiales bacterium]
MPTGPAARIGRSEAKERLLSAGRKLLADRGIGAAEMGVELADAIGESGVPKSSAYRLFSSETGTPQSNYTSELMRSLLEGGAHSDPDLGRDAALTVLAEHPGIFDDGSPLELAMVLRELVRQVSNANSAALIDSTSLRVYVTALASSVDPGPDPSPGSVEASLKASEAQEPPFIPLYKELTELFGLRLRLGWSWQMFDAVIASSTYGNALLHPFNEHVANIVRSTGPNGDDQQWTTTGIILEGTALIALEPNPRVTNAADLSSWLQ